MNKDNEIVKIETTAIEPQAITPMTMLQMAVQQGADLDKLEQLMGLQERWEANEAKKAYVAAMTGFKSEVIEIVKDKHVSYKNKTGGYTDYMHASLFGVVTAAANAMSKHGLSHTWKTSQGDAGMITVTCVITHREGHSEETSLSSGPDQSGGKNNIQAVSSTVSYLERYTFLAATGLAAKDMDDDGKTAEPVETITEEQIANLEALITEVRANKPAFVRYCRVNNLNEIQSGNYHLAIRALESKRNTQ